MAHAARKTRAGGSSEILAHGLSGANGYLRAGCAEDEPAEVAGSAAPAATGAGGARRLAMVPRRSLWWR